MEPLLDTIDIWNHSNPLIDSLDLIDIQNLCIHLLNGQDGSFLLRLVREAGRLDEPSRAYLQQCISFASEKGINREYCATAEYAVRTILARQYNVEKEKKITLETIAIAIGGTARMTISRLRQGTWTPSKDTIRELCYGFRIECDRIFWENMLFGLFPKTSDPEPWIKSRNGDQQNAGSVSSRKAKYNFWWKAEYNSLKYIVELLKKMERLEKSREHLPQNEDKNLTLLMSEVLKNPSKADPLMLREPTKSKIGNQHPLYPTISQLVKDNGMTLGKLRENELQVSETSWSTWKENWTEAAAVNFSYLPKARLRRNHMLIMAIVFKLSYLDSLRFLRLAGYRLGNTEKNGDSPSDRDIADFLLGDRENEEDFKQKLRNMKL